MFFNKKSGISNNEALQIGKLKRESSEKIAPLFIKKYKKNFMNKSNNESCLLSGLKNDCMKVSKKIETSLMSSMLFSDVPFPIVSHVNQGKLDLILNINSSYEHGITRKLGFYINKKFIKNETAIDRTDILKNRCEKNIKNDNITVTFCSIMEMPEKKFANKKLNSLKSHSLWTEKYKPKNCTEILGNKEAALQLKTWLNSWQLFNLKDGYSSSEEFYTSDSKSSKIEKNLVAILIGPNGCGKTACVYAIAQELNYKVLEVNASSKRTGKQILKDFKEATKSYSIESSKKKKNYIPVLEETKETKITSRNSLILIEDVDLIFKEDEGLMSALFHLAYNTKRPIIMTITNVYSNISKLVPQQIKIQFEHAVYSQITALMQHISLSEKGCKLSQNFLDALHENGDLRKQMLQLQYLLLSNSKRFSYDSLSLNSFIWKKMSIYIYKLHDEMIREGNTNKDSTVNVKNNLFHLIYKKIKCFTLMSYLLNIQDPTFFLCNEKCKDYCLTDEYGHVSFNYRVTSSSIGNWLKRYFKENMAQNLTIPKSASYVYYPSETKVLRDTIIDTALHQISSDTLDRRSLTVDYLSSVRTVCRAEELRYQINSKRGNRFFHYYKSSEMFKCFIESNRILSFSCNLFMKN